jgi:elongator complex protein 3
MSDRVLNEIVDRLVSEDVTDKETIEQIKRSVCSKYSAPSVPSNGEILNYSDSEDNLKTLLKRKPVRTISGVSPVAIMTSPHMCPHGKCLYCPGGPASKFSSSQAYTGDEPAGQRAQKTKFDPFAQVNLRLNQLQYIGHPVNKVELILMGGTMTARSHDYQEWFVRRALQAMNTYNPKSQPEPSAKLSLEKSNNNNSFCYFEPVKKENELADVRCIGLTFETKPDWCGKKQIRRMLRLGCTKVEIGVQTTYERVNREMHRGHGMRASKKASRMLKDSGLKVGYHLMPGQPTMSEAMCREDFHQIFCDNQWKPDYLKIYPTLVVEGTRTYDMWKNGEFNPLNTDQAAEIVADAMSNMPRYVRLQRVQRDIPAHNIEAGVQKSNLRQIARQKLNDRGETCNCIRCREVGHNDEEPEEIKLTRTKYESAGGTEFFISFEDLTKNILVGFCRLRFPNSQFIKQLNNSSVIRELHVYGDEAVLGEDDDSWQHRGYGKRLVKEAERISRQHGYDKICVTSGIGAKEYYRNKLQYENDGYYMSKSFN